MTADEIRNQLEMGKHPSWRGAPFCFGSNSPSALVLVEIAAQLAEQNGYLKRIAEALNKP